MNSKPFFYYIIFLLFLNSNEVLAVPTDNIPGNCVSSLERLTKEADQAREEILENLRMLVEKSGRSHLYFASRLGLSERAFSYLMAGRSMIGYTQLYGLIHLLGANYEEVFGSTGEQRLFKGDAESISAMRNMKIQCFTPKLNLVTNRATDSSPKSDE